MITVQVRKQGGAAIITIPSQVLKMLEIGVGSEIELEIVDKEFIARPIQGACRKRYTISQLLHGLTKEDVKKLNKQTSWSREGKPVGKEIT